MIQGFGQEITEIPAFGHDITEVRAMGELAWQKQSSIPDYLCFTALEAGQFTLTIPAAVTPTYLSYVEWSKDGRTWNHRDNTSDIETIDVQVASGEKVYWRGSGFSTASGATVATMSSKFSSDCRFDASGNIMSMLLADNFDGVTSLPSGRYTFAGLFHGCSTIVNAEHLLLPATTLRQDCYRSMFLSCTSLVTPPNLPSTTLSPSCYLLMFGYCRSMTTAPVLPATVLTSQCYYQMFYDCVALTTAPALPATSMVYFCYYRMFEGCTGLTSAPELPAKNTFTSCYQRMFYNCTNLNYVKCMAEDLSSTNCVADWLNGVSSTGTFIQASGVEWPRGASGIPTGWIINPDYLCFTALDNNTQFTFTKYINLLTTVLPSISYSMDGGDTWTEVAMSGSGNEDVVTTPAVNAGDKVLWKANATRLGMAANKYSNFTSTGRFNVSGNIMSLLYGDNHYGKTDTTTNTYSFGSLFRGNDKLIDASQLKLPTGHMNAADLLGLFHDCTSLVHGAPLYAPNIPDSCCYNMYRGCTSMTEMPAIAATSMIKDNGDPANYGLYYAFYGCSNMEGEVKLNIVGDVAQQVLDACFSNCSKITSADLAFNGALGKMALRGAFSGCTSLSHVKCLATSFYDDGTAANGSLYNWMNNVSSTGVFVQAEGIQWPQGKSGIPTGWLAYDEGEEIPNDYTPCDYIYNRSTGGGGVDLGFKFRLLDYSVEAKFKQDDISNGIIIGTYTNNSGAIWFYNYSVSVSFRINACYSSGWHYNRDGFKPLDTDTHIIRYVGGADGCYQINDGTQSSSTNISTWAAEESTDRLFIFGRSQSQNTYKGRIYYLKVWNTATKDVICNLIPCSRNSDGAAGFWDTAQEKFFTSTYWTAHNDNE